MPTLSIVKSTYQGLEVNFTEGGWFNATKAAERYGKRPCLYCITFKHGVMKIGATSNILRRLKKLSAHGIFTSLFDKMVIESCDNHALFEAEKIAIKEIAKISQRFDAEVFKVIDTDIVRDIFIKSISNSSEYFCKSVTEGDYHKISVTSNLYGAFASIAYSHHSEIYKKEAVDFVLSNTPENGCINEVEWFDALYKLHPFTINLINKICIDNAMLIQSGLGRDERQMALSKFVSEFKAPIVSQLTEPAQQLLNAK